MSVAELKLLPLIDKEQNVWYSPEEAIRTLKEKGYDTSSALSYAKAAKSWTEKSGAEWKLWTNVVSILGKEEEGKA